MLHGSRGVERFGVPLATKAIILVTIDIDARTLLENPSGIIKKYMFQQFNERKEFITIGTILIQIIRSSIHNPTGQAHTEEK